MSRLLRWLATWFVRKPVPPPVVAANFYVSPQGLPTNNGSLLSPWDLATAFAQPPAVLPGAIIWLRGGVYIGPFISTLKGTREQPIKVRQYAGERATIDIPIELYPLVKNPLTIQGTWTYYYDFEVTNSDPSREDTFNSGSGFRGAAVNVYGTYCKLINLIIHDNGNGIGLWMQALDAEVYGCIIYNIGWDSNRGHGHSLYTQNDTGIKRIEDNLMCNSYGYGLHAYTEAGQIRNFHIEGNTILCSGILSRGGPSLNVLIGGSPPSSGITFNSNVMYQPIDAIANNVRLSYSARHNVNISASNNISAGGYVSFDVSLWDTVTFRNNLIYSVAQLISAGPQFNGYLWDNNRYYGRGKDNEFGDTTRTFGFTQWQAATGLDANSTYANGSPMGFTISVRPNKYTPKRALITVCNWEMDSKVDVDVSSVLAVGDTYEVRQGQDYFGLNLGAGIYRGGKITIPLTTLTVAKPIGYTAPMPALNKLVNAFILIGK